MRRTWGATHRIWQVVGLTTAVAVLVGVGAVGVGLNQQESRAALAARRVQGSLAVTEQADRLNLGLQKLTTQLSTLAREQSFSLAAKDPADLAALQTFVDESVFYGASLGNLRSEILTFHTTGAVPALTDPGYLSMVTRRTVSPTSGSRLFSAGMLSPVMDTAEGPVIAIAVLITRGPAVSGTLLGFLKLRDPEVRAILQSDVPEGSPLASAMSIDATGRVVTSDRDELIGTVAPSELRAGVVSDRSAAVSFEPTVDGRPHVGFAANDLPGGWSMIGYTDSVAFYAEARRRSDLINIALIGIVVLAALVLAITVIRSNRSIRRSGERFEALVQYGSDIIVVLSASGAVQYVSSSFATILGYSHDDMNFGVDLIPPADRPVISDAFRSVLREPGTVGRCEIRLYRADGSEMWMDMTLTNMTTSMVGGIVVNARDISDSRRLREQLHEQATRDPLTGLANRRLVYAGLNAALGGDEQPVAVLFIDLDRFKPVNDRLGHDAGDELLRCAADRIRNCVRPVDTLGRVGGDEFVVVAPGVGPDDADALAERIVRALDEPFALAGDPRIVVGASVGVEFAAPGDGPDEVLGRADAAMYRAKQAGGHRYAAAVGATS